MGEDRRRADLDRLTVAAAADALGVSQDAVRKRIARGTIQSDRDESGRVYVYLPPSETVHRTDQDTARADTSKTVTSGAWRIRSRSSAKSWSGRTLS